MQRFGLLNAFSVFFKINMGHISPWVGRVRDRLKRTNANDTYSTQIKVIP